MRESKQFTLEQLASLTQCKLVGNPGHIITNVSDLETATPQDASFLSNPKYKHEMQHSNAGVIFIDAQTTLPDNKNFLISDHPSRSFQQVVDAIYPQRSPSGFTGIHSSAVIHPSVKLGQDVTIGPQVVLDEGVTIGDRSFIGSGTYIGPETSIGQDCLIHPRVVIREQCMVGNRVIIQPGAVIGACGYGYLTDKQGRHIKLNQVGYVVIEDDVEIGANTTIDRARFKSTTIGKGTKIDNLVLIAHGVQIGPHNLIVGQTGIAGSTTTGRHVVLAGQVAVAGHLQLEDGVIVAGKSGVSKSLPPGKYNGIPAMPVNEYNRLSVYWRQIEKYVQQIKELNGRVKKIEEVLQEDQSKA